MKIGNGNLITSKAYGLDELDARQYAAINQEGSVKSSTLGGKILRKNDQTLFSQSHFGQTLM